LLKESTKLHESDDSGLKENHTLLVGSTERDSSSFFVSLNDQYRDAVQSFERMKYWIVWGNTALNFAFLNWSKRVMFYTARIVMTQSIGPVVNSDSVGELSIKLLLWILLCTIGWNAIVRIVRFVLYFVFLPYQTIVWMIQSIIDMIRLTFPILGFVFLIDMLALLAGTEPLSDLGKILLGLMCFVSGRISMRLVQLIVVGVSLPVRLVIGAIKIVLSPFVLAYRIAKQFVLFLKAVWCLLKFMYGFAKCVLSLVWK
jgi:hypothetical protein